MLSPGGVPSATEDFTSDKARLVAAIDNFSGTKLTSATVERDQESRQFYDGVPIHGGKDPERREGEPRLVAHETLEAIALHAERIEGRRKALLLFSEGIDYDTADIMGESQRYASEVVEGDGPGDRRADAHQRRSLLDRSACARHAAGRYHRNTDLRTQSGQARRVSERGIDEEFAASIRSLRDMAQATGGFLATDKGLGRAFDQIVDETSDTTCSATHRRSRPGQANPET